MSLFIHKPFNLLQGIYAQASVEVCNCLEKIVNGVKLK